MGQCHAHFHSDSHAPTRSGKALGNISAYVNFFLPLGWVRQWMGVSNGGQEQHHQRCSLCSPSFHSSQLSLSVLASSVLSQLLARIVIPPPIRPGPPPGRSNSDVARFVCLNATFTLWIVAIFFLQLATRKPESENGV